MVMSDVRRLKFIRSAQAAGFTLAEIGQLLELSAADDRARARELAKARVQALDEKIAELQEAREALSGLAAACSKQRGGCLPDPLGLRALIERASPLSATTPGRCFPSI
jgi:MerR family mercuric resistance operon transcriptional regulator